MRSFLKTLWKTPHQNLKTLYNPYKFPRFSTTPPPNSPNSDSTAQNSKPNSKETQQNSKETQGNSAAKPEFKENASTQDASSKETKETSKSSENSEQTQQQSAEKLGFRERLKTSSPKLSKALEFGIYAWNLTFPSEKYHNKFELAKQKAKEQKKQETIILTEEDMEKMQNEIPEWKRTALILKEEQQKRESLKEKLANKFKNRFNDTKFAKEIYKSDSYKEFQTFKKEMHQFKEDLKDHVENSPNAFVQTSLGIYSKVSNESSVARAIREMRNIDPNFDLYELEEDAKGIFEAAYTTFLQGNLELLEKMCGEMALGYFKVLLRKMEAEKTEPKYKYLWQIEQAFFTTALIPEKKLPVFVFTIKTQEIHCFISKVDKRIVDGDDERLMNYEYSFAITPHQNPDIESVGHAWEIIEVQPRQVLKMLV